MQSTALLHLLQLVSPSLPVGAYSYSQGLEGAIERGWVHDEASARHWIAEHLEQVLARFEAPLFWRLYHAFASADGQAVADWSERFLASRETAEFRAETLQMGYSLGRLLIDLKVVEPSLLACLPVPSELPFPTALACASVALHVPAEAALLGMLFSWVENQVLVCVKSVPLGQVAGQRMLLALGPVIDSVAQQVPQLPDDALSSWWPGLSLLSMQHEVQYSRLYRS